MYVIVVNINNEEIKFLTFLQKLVENFCDECIFDTFSQAANFANKFNKDINITTKVLNLKDFCLTKKEEFQNWAIQFVA